MRSNSFLRLGLALGCLLLPRSGGEPPAMEPGANRVAYVSNLMSHTVSVIDLEAGRWLRDLHLGRYPIFSSLHPHDPTKMILAFHNYDRTEDEDMIALVDLRTEKTVKRVSFPGIGLPSGFVYDAKRDRLYIADENLHKIFALDGTTLDRIFEFPAGLVPVHVDVTPDGRWLVATNRKSANLYVYDLDSILGGAKDGIYTIPLGPSPGLRWDAGDPAAAPFSSPMDIECGGDSRTCYVTDLGAGELLVVDIRERRITDRIALEWPPFSLEINRDESLAFICHATGDAITVVDLEKKVVSRIIRELTPNPIDCKLDEDHGILIATGWGRDMQGGVHIVDLKTGEVLETILPEGAKASIGITIAESR